MHCILLKKWTGKAPVMLVFMVPVMASASVAKQNTSRMAQISTDIGECGKCIDLGSKCGDEFGSRSWAYCLVVGNVGEGHHPQASAGALVTTHNCVATVHDGAVDFGQGNCASGVAHCDN
jgi:hypothetical protein